MSWKRRAILLVQATLLFGAASAAIKASCINPQQGGSDQVWINSALASGSAVIELCPGKTYDLTGPIQFAAPNQELRTYGFPTDSSRALLSVRSTDGTAVVGKDLSGVKVRNLRMDAGGSGSSLGAPLIELGGNATDQVVDQVQAGHPRGWTVLHVWEGAGLTCKRATVTNNTIGPSGLGYPILGEWADGISLACADSLVSNNTVEDATDGGIVIFGSPGSVISGNTIRATNQVMLGGINLVDWGPWSGDFTGVIVESNRIDAAGAQIQVAMAMGYPVWWCDPTTPINRGALVQSNVLSGHYMGYGYAVAGVSGWTVLSNTSLATHSGEPIDCSGNAISPTPSAFLKNSSISSGNFQGDFREAVLHGVVTRLAGC